MIPIIVAFPNIDNGKSIRNLLFRNGYEVVSICASGASTVNAAEGLGDGILVCGYKFPDMMFSEVRALIPDSFDMLLVASQDKWLDCSDNDIVCVALPLKVNDFLNTIEMMSQAIYRRRKKRKSLPKERNTEEQKLIYEAKKILMEKNNMTEPEAHRYIQKTSMDSGASLVETAGMVIDIMMR